MSPTTPTPSPHPSHPKPGRRSLPTTVPVPPRSQPEKWGRVDEDGSAWVITQEGERLIGTWQAGAPEEGLAHFGRRYDDMVTEVALLERRLDTHPMEAASTRSHAQNLLESLPTATVIGDLQAVANRLTALIERSYTAESEAQELRQKRREEAIARKTALVEEAEQIGQSATQWKQSGDRLRAILEEWKTIRGIDRKTDDLLWKRFSRARENFNRRRGSYFAELDRERAAAARAKEELVLEAESLQVSDDWNATAGHYRELMAQWKKAGRAQKEVDDQLWARFKKAQDVFFARRKAAFDERDSEFAANAAAKRELLATHGDAILEEKDPAAARELLTALMAKWDEIGRVPRADMRPLEHELSALTSHVEKAEKSAWQRTDPAVHARAQQFWTRVRDFAAQAQKAEALGRTEEAEKLRSQAAQWEEWAKAAEESINDM